MAPLLMRSTATFDRLGDGLIWEEWATITRFLESSRCTLLPAAMRWEELAQLNPTEANLEWELPGTLYRVSLDQHIAALRDLRPLYASALVLYYSLAESAAAERLGRDDLVGCKGIEDWATQLLSAAGARWRSESERAGLVEVGVVRNLVAHGERRYSTRAITTLVAAGVPGAPREGDPVVLNYETLKKYRSRLKSLLNRSGLTSAPVEQASRTDGA